ncbi:MAG TPA: type II secretion system protein [Patescibacteria group bacterium]
MKKNAGYTLLELLLTIVVFSAIMGALFSAFLALRQSDTVRAHDSLTIQLAQLAFSPMVSSLKEAEGSEQVKVLNREGEFVCQTVHGFYLNGTQGVKISPPEVMLDLGDTLVALKVEETTNAAGLPTYEWVRYEYSLETKQVKSDPVTMLLQRKYRVFPTESFQWPNLLSSCDITQLPWDRLPSHVQEKQLTPSDMSVQSLHLRLNSSDAKEPRFASVTFTVLRDGKTVTLHTTVGSSYVQRDAR